MRQTATILSKHCLQHELLEIAFNSDCLNQVPSRWMIKRSCSRLCDSKPSLESCSCRELSKTHSCFLSRTPLLNLSASCQSSSIMQGHRQMCSSETSC